MFVLAEGGGLGPLLTWWPMIAIVAIMYFLLIAPQRKKEKRRREMLTSIEKNDRIVTIGGIQGIVKNISDTDVTLLVDEKRDFTIKLNRSAVYSIVRRDKEGEL